MAQIRVLIIDDDEAGRTALASVLSGEDCHVELVTRAEDALKQVRQGGWHLILANVAMSSLSGPIFDLLKELGQGGGSVRVLFLVPQGTPDSTRQHLESLKLPYATKPFHLMKFLEQVSDLLRSAGIVGQPLFAGPQFGDAPPAVGAREDPAARTSRMFAARDPALDYTEEELKQFEEEERRKKEQQKEDKHRY